MEYVLIGRRGGVVLMWRASRAGLAEAAAELLLLGYVVTARHVATGREQQMGGA
jgi:hypothetical protein